MAVTELKAYALERINAGDNPEEISTKLSSAIALVYSARSRTEILNAKEGGLKLLKPNPKLYAQKWEDLYSPVTFHSDDIISFNENTQLIINGIKLEYRSEYRWGGSPDSCGEVFKHEQTLMRVHTGTEHTLFSAGPFAFQKIQSITIDGQKYDLITRP